ncbi:unnamed protein product [Mycena citricolor]|uniref:Uncharacterized protein n=1 Tax=Mycena citricolor TaxID=2018698 RepID=A0AAD2H2Y4_9AGAR|nr:unnamed protein product [Mycena citricolor]
MIIIWILSCRDEESCRDTKALETALCLPLLKDFGIANDPLSPYRRFRGLELISHTFQSAAFALETEVSWRASPDCREPCRAFHDLRRPRILGALLHLDHWPLGVTDDAVRLGDNRRDVLRRGFERKREVHGEAELREAREEEHVGEPARRDAVQRAATLLGPFVVHVSPLCARDAEPPPGGGAARACSEGQLEPGTEDEHFDGILGAVGDYAVRGQRIHTLPVRINEGDVRAVERGKVIVVERRPLAPDGVPRLELRCGFRVPHNLVDACPDPFGAWQVQTMQLCDVLRNLLRRHYPWRTNNSAERRDLARRVGYEIRAFFGLIGQYGVVVDRPGVLPSLASRNLVLPLFWISGMLVSHVDAGGCALEHEEFFGPLGELRDHLDRSGAGADDPHALVLELVQIRRCRGSACDGVVPPTSVECRAFELIETRQGWDLRRHYHPCSEAYELRGDRERALRFVWSPIFAHFHGPMLVR